jgi:hypothetical protein
VLEAVLALGDDVVTHRRIERDREVLTADVADLLRL